MTELPVQDAPPARQLGRTTALLLWPALVLSSAAILGFGIASGYPESLPLRTFIFFNLSYFGWLGPWLFYLERRYPYRTSWRQSDRQLGADLGHTLLDKGLVQVTLLTLMSLPFFANRGEDGVIGSWPLWAQVVVGLTAMEFGLYWAHRLSHEWPALWRYHAVHHSVRRLWVVNTGRFHFIDSNLSVLSSVPFLLGAGISMEAIIWVNAITAWLGLLTHCNIAMQGGWLDYLFNTPNLHRWHHSTDPAEGNNNYGQNLVIWDQLFGTFLRRPDAQLGEIGISERMPRRFIQQLLVPFIWKRYQRESANADPSSLV